MLQAIIIFVGSMWAWNRMRRQDQNPDGDLQMGDLRPQTVRNPGQEGNAVQAVNNVASVQNAAPVDTVVAELPGVGAEADEPVQLTANNSFNQVSLTSDSLAAGTVVMYIEYTLRGDIVNLIQADRDVLSDPVRLNLFRNAISPQIRQQINSNWIMGLLPAEIAAHIQRLHMEGDSEQILNLIDGLIQRNPVLDTDRPASSLLIEDINASTHGADELAVSERLAILKGLTDSLGMTSKGNQPTVNQAPSSRNKNMKSKPNSTENSLPKRLVSEEEVPRYLGMLFNNPSDAMITFWDAPNPTPAETQLAYQDFTNAQRGPLAQMLGYMANMGPTDVLRISMGSSENSENFAFTRASFMNPKNASLLSRTMEQILSAAQNGTPVMAEVVPSSATRGLGRGNQNVSSTTPAPLGLPASEAQVPQNQLSSDKKNAFLAWMKQFLRSLPADAHLGMGGGVVPQSNTVNISRVVHPERMSQAGVVQTTVGRKKSTPQQNEPIVTSVPAAAVEEGKSTVEDDLAAITSGASEGMGTGVGIQQSVEAVPEPELQAAVSQNEAAKDSSSVGTYKSSRARTSHGGVRQLNKTGSAWSRPGVSKGSRELPTNLGASKPSKQPKEATQHNRIKSILNENVRNMQSIITSLTRVIEQGDEIHNLLTKPGVVLPEYLRKQVPTSAYFEELRVLKEEQSRIFNLLVKESEKNSPSDISDIVDNNELHKIRKETRKVEELFSKITTSLSTADASLKERIADASLKKRIAEELEQAQRLTDAQLITAVIAENAGLSVQTEQAQDIQDMVRFVLGGDNLPGASVPQDSQAALENESHHAALVAAITEGVTSQQVAIGASQNQSLTPQDIDQQCTALLARGYAPQLVAMVREACMKVITQQSGEVLVVGHKKNGVSVISFIFSLQEMQNILFTLLQGNPQGLTFGMFSFEQASVLSLYLEEVERVGGQIRDAASLINDMQRLPMNPGRHQIEGVIDGHAVGGVVGRDWVVKKEFNQALAQRSQEMRVAAGATKPFDMRRVLEFIFALLNLTKGPSKRSQLEIEDNANLGLPASAAQEMPLAISGGIVSVSVPRGLGLGLPQEAHSTQEVELPESEVQPIAQASSNDNGLTQQGHISGSRGLKHGLPQKVNGQQNTNQLGQRGGVMKLNKKATAKQPGEAELNAALGRKASSARSSKTPSGTQSASKFSEAAIALDKEFNATQKTYIGANGKLLLDKERFRAEINRLSTTLANPALLISNDERNSFHIKLAAFSQSLKTAEAIRANPFMTRERGVNAEMQRITAIVMNHNQPGTIQHELNELQARYDQEIRAIYDQEIRAIYDQKIRNNLEPQRELTDISQKLAQNNLEFRRELTNISQKLAQINADVEQIRKYSLQSGLRAANQAAILDFLREFDQSKKSLDSTIVQLGNRVNNREQLRKLVSDVQNVVENAPRSAVLPGVIAALTGSLTPESIGLISQLLNSQSNPRGGLLLSGTNTVATAGASNTQMEQSIREMCRAFVQTGANEESVAEIEAGLLEVANATNPRESRLVILTVGPEGQTFLDLRPDQLNKEVIARIVEGMARGDQIIVRLLSQRMAAKIIAVMEHATRNNLRLQSTAQVKQLIDRIQSDKSNALNPARLLGGLTAESTDVSLVNSSANLDESVEQQLAKWSAEPEVDKSYSVEKFVDYLASLLLVAQMQAAQTEAQQRAVMGMLGYLVQAAAQNAENQESNVLENGAGAGSGGTGTPNDLTIEQLEQLDALRRSMEGPSSDATASESPLSEEQLAQLAADLQPVIALYKPQLGIEAGTEAPRAQPSPGQSGTSGAGGQPSPAPVPHSRTKGSTTVPRKLDPKEPHPLEKPKSRKGHVRFATEDEVIRDKSTSRSALPDELLQYSKILDAIANIRDNTPKLRKEHCDELDRLHATLGTSMMHYLDDRTHNTKDAFSKFYNSVMPAVKHAEKQFKNEGVLWNLIRPILNAVIQVVNAIGKLFGAKKEFGLFKSAATQAWENSEAVQGFKAALEAKYAKEEPTPQTPTQK